MLSPTLSPTQHIEGASNGNGTVVCAASYSHTMFQPGSGKKFTLFSPSGFSSIEDAQPMLSAYSLLGSRDREEANLLARAQADLFPILKENTLVFIDQELPYGLAIVMARNVELHLFGVYTPDFSLLAVTNLQNFEEMLEQHHPKEFWIHRFKPRDTCQFVFSTRRVCSRWFRWGAQENLSSTAARFVALERSLFKSSLSDG